MPERFEPVELAAADGARLSFCRHGGQLLSWRAAGRELLFLSSRAEYREGGAIRGGVPVIFPQFADFGLLPKHGFARLAPWHLAATGLTESGQAWAELHLSSTHHTDGDFPHAYELCLRLAADADALELDLSVFNPGATAFGFTAALHGYFAVRDVESVRLEGLEGCIYRDSALGRDAIEREARLAPLGELDRIYRSAQPLSLVDGEHRLRFSMEGFTETVIWNPGAVRAQALGDLGEEEWRHFLCIEAAHALTPIVLEPGRRWLGRQRIQRVS
ncbi:MAG: D-hexose-6-phosphate mutarotase [Gammaproteobacteria bacterium]|nr:D-hexose-6-phosphate mutarotase [Gammaproteobacteria bacterium]